MSIDANLFQTVKEGTAVMTVECSNVCEIADTRECSMHFLISACFTLRQHTSILRYTKSPLGGVAHQHDDDNKLAPMCGYFSDRLSLVSAIKPAAIVRRFKRICVKALSTVELLSENKRTCCRHSALHAR